MPSKRGATNSHILPHESAFSSKNSNGNFIEHRVSRFDTLAGVAINYGVEIADIKRVNGLVTDIQMFAHKSLQIPLPGKHPPSPVMPNGSIQNRQKPPPPPPPAPRRPHHDILQSLQSLKPTPPPRPISPAMRTLQIFYNLTNPQNPNPSQSQTPDPFNRHRRSRSLANFTSLENGNKSIRRRQKADAGVSRRSLSPEKMDSAAEGLDSVRKSWSASNLRESESGFSAIRARRKKKMDGVFRPVFDGLPRPVVGCGNKAALD